MVVLAMLVGIFVVVAILGVFWVIGYAADPLKEKQDNTLPDHMFRVFFGFVVSVIVTVLLTIAYAIGMAVLY